MRAVLLLSFLFVVYVLSNVQYFIFNNISDSSYIHVLLFSFLYSAFTVFAIKNLRNISKDNLKKIFLPLIILTPSLLLAPLCYFDITCFYINKISNYFAYLYSLLFFSGYFMMLFCLFNFKKDIKYNESKKEEFLKRRRIKKRIKIS